MQPHNPYDFITNPQAPAKKSLLGGGGKQKLILFVAGATVVTLILVIVASLFGGTSSTDSYWAALRQHTEIIRVTELGTTSARNNRAKNLAVTTRQTLQSQQTDLNSLAQKVGGIKKIEPKLLQAGKDATTDERLTKADQLNKFDEEFLTVLHEELTAYQAMLKTLYDDSSSQTTRDILSGMYDQIQLLVDGSAQTETSGS